MLKAAISGQHEDKVLSFASYELKYFLEAAGLTVSCSSDAGEDAEWVFDLVVDPGMPSFCFSATYKPIANSKNSVILSGHDSSCVLHSVYTALEKAGICFDITGPVMPEKLDLNRLKNISEKVCPAVSCRGIRQHINFPMDISSYALEEAKEYIRNLARLRFNYITFHSYPGQWIPVKLSGSELLAGGFFYNITHYVPEHPVIKKVLRNEKIFCIPEIEPYFDQPEERSRRSVEWLGAVMNEAKRVGMKVQLSFELREYNLEDGIKTFEAALDNYPMIDALEIITQECGGFRFDNPSAQDLRDLVSRLFGPETLLDEAVSSRITDGQNQTPVILQELAQNIQVVKELKKRMAGDKLPELLIGVYATDHRTLRLVLPILRQFVPHDVKYAFLPAHGARAAAESVKAMEMTSEDWKRTMMCSWIEFDGNMYLQQNTVTGIRQMLIEAQETLGGSPLTGMYFNHWRTAENRTPAKYASVACLEGPVNPEEFYKNYARALGITDIDRYIQAMQGLDDADDQVRNTLPNIGFCFVNCWWNNPSKLGYIANYDPGLVESAKNKYEKVLSDLEICANTSAGEEGKHYIGFLINRVKCSIIHLQAIKKLTELQPICKDNDPDLLDEFQRRPVLNICDSASEIVEDYMALHAEAIEDRGCEGNLVDYYQTLPVVIAKIKATFGGLLDQEPVIQIGADAPPPPAI